jgi:hypothetical protein
MNHPAEEAYTATCCTARCGWEQVCHTKYQALVVARKHEEAKELHLTIVLPPAGGPEAAWFLREQRLQTSDPGRGPSDSRQRPIGGAAMPSIIR